MWRWRASSPRSRPSARHAARTGRATRPGRTCSTGWSARFCNARHSHSAIGYRSPMAFEGPAGPAQRPVNQTGDRPVSAGRHSRTRDAKLAPDAVGWMPDRIWRARRSHYSSVMEAALATRVQRVTSLETKRAKSDRLSSSTRAPWRAHALLTSLVSRAAWIAECMLSSAN